jgi:hypothetical protein
VKQHSVRFMAFVLLNFAALQIHSLVQPFGRKWLNQAETCSHALLLLVSAVLTAYLPPYDIAVQVIVFSLVVPPGAAWCVVVLREHWSGVTTSLWICMRGKPTRNRAGAWDGRSDKAEQLQPDKQNHSSSDYVEGGPSDIDPYFASSDDSLTLNPLHSSPLDADRTIEMQTLQLSSHPSLFPAAVQAPPPSRSSLMRIWLPAPSSKTTHAGDDSSSHHHPDPEIIPSLATSSAEHDSAWSAADLPAVLLSVPHSAQRSAPSVAVAVPALVRHAEGPGTPSRVSHWGSERSLTPSNEFEHERSL